MSKSIRIRTTPGSAGEQPQDKHIRVKLEQDFDQLEILSLRIDQENLYQSFSANHGVIAGRIDINSGFGLKNAKVSIFIPLSDSDEENDMIRALYPYKSYLDKNSNGVRYNLLPRKQQHVDHTPTGTFPDKRQALDNPTMLEVYDKYYKFTTRTNEAGDYMFCGVPVGEQTIFIDIDVSDIGFLSARPYEMMAQGKNIEEFESRFKFKSNNNIDKLPQVISTSQNVEVIPFWADDLPPAGKQIGITRFDYSVTEYELIPTSLFMGSIFSDDEKDSLNKNCRPRKKMGRLNELITGEGKLEAITRTQSGDIKIYKDIPDDAIDENGNWAVQVPMNLRKLVTDEFGALIPSPDGVKGVASEADFRFRVTMDKADGDKRQRTRAKFLVPNMTNNYRYGEYSASDLIIAQNAGEPIFKLNDQLSYVTDPNSLAYQDPTNEYNYLEDFYTFRWKKVYTVRQFIPRYQPNKRDKNKNFIGLKEITEGVGVNKVPWNRLFVRGHFLYTIICFLLLIFGFIIAFINSLINVINSIWTFICEIRFPLPCFYFKVSKCDNVTTGGDVSNSESTSGIALPTNAGSCTDFIDWKRFIPCGLQIKLTAGRLPGLRGSLINGYKLNKGDFPSLRITIKWISIRVGYCLPWICLLSFLCKNCSNDEECGVSQSNPKKACGQCCPGQPGDGDKYSFNCYNNKCNCPDENVTGDDGCCDCCCEKVKLIRLKCDEENLVIKPTLFTIYDKCDGDRITTCKSCSGPFFWPLSTWVACKLERLANRLNMLDFEFYNDWLNGSLYFPLIKRKVKIKRAKKAKKGKPLKKGQGQVKKDKFCDYDCDGGNNEADYQHPEKYSVYEVVVKDGNPFSRKKELVYEGCKTILRANKRIKSQETEIGFHDTAEKALGSIIFKGQTVGTNKPCQFTLSEWCDSNQTPGDQCDGEELGNTKKDIKIKTKEYPTEHGKPKYVKIKGDPNDDLGLDTWKNMGGHGHHRNKCKKNYLIEKEEYTKDVIADCITSSNKSSDQWTYFEIDPSNTCPAGSIVEAGADCTKYGLSKPCCKAPKDSPIVAEGVEFEENNDAEGPCTFDCAKQGTAACTSRCKCDADYNQKAINRGLIKWENGSIYYASMIEPDDLSLDSNGLSSFNSEYYKSNILFATNITELGSATLCDIDEAPFIIDDLEPTTYKASEEELSVKLKGGTQGDPHQLKEKDGEINLRAYVEFTCTGPRCMNIKSSLTQSQIGSELIDLDDDSLEIDSCVAYADIDDDIRRYFCQRFGTYTPTWSNNQVTDMKVNYVRPGGSKGENYYETFTDKILSGGTFSGAFAYNDSGDDGIASPGDVIALEGSINDGEPLTPGDRCGYWPGDVNNNNDLTDDLNNIRFFYSMSLHDDDVDTIEDFPKPKSNLYMTTSNFNTDDPLVEDIYGITPRSSQTPYFFYFGLIPGKTALHKLVAKFFADKIDKNTLEKVTENPSDSPVPSNDQKEESLQSIIGSCIKTT